MAGSSDFDRQTLDFLKSLLKEVPEAGSAMKEFRSAMGIKAENQIVNRSAIETQIGQIEHQLETDLADERKQAADTQFIVKESEHARIEQQIVESKQYKAFINETSFGENRVNDLETFLDKNMDKLSLSRQAELGHAVRMNLTDDGLETLLKKDHDKEQKVYFHDFALEKSLRVLTKVKDEEVLKADFEPKALEQFSKLEPKVKEQINEAVEKNDHKKLRELVKDLPNEFKDALVDSNQKHPHLASYTLEKVYAEEAEKIKDKFKDDKSKLSKLEYIDRRNISTEEKAAELAKFAHEEGIEAPQLQKIIREDHKQLNNEPGRSNSIKRLNPNTPQPTLNAREANADLALNATDDEPIKDKALENINPVHPRDINVAQSSNSKGLTGPS